MQLYDSGISLMEFVEHAICAQVCTYIGCVAWRPPVWLEVAWRVAHPSEKADSEAP